MPVEENSPDHRVSRAGNSASDRRLADPQGVWVGKESFLYNLLPRAFLDFFAFSEPSAFNLTSNLHETKLRDVELGEALCTYRKK